MKPFGSFSGRKRAIVRLSEDCRGADHRLTKILVLA
jgi:hypothetical protein